VPYTARQRAALAIIPPLAVLLIRLLGATLRYHEVTAPGVTPGDILPGPSIYAFWHRSLLLAAHRFRNRGIAILISRSFDGELIARTVELLGFRAIRGSSSRGGPTALRQMAQAHTQGARCAFTADGPKGPSQIAKPGPIHLATLVHAAQLGAFYVLPERAWVLRSWDRFLIPKPFSRVAVTWPPLAPATLPDLQCILDESVRMAERLD
jgi:lysophospholipid acyltransferase (LPLAT)-like uncharacterized protein